MPGLLGGAQGGGLGGGGQAGGGMGNMNPYFGGLNEQEQKAGMLRMIMANLGEMDFQGGAHHRPRPRTFGLGQLDAVVDEAYQRAEREKSWMARERQEKQEEERYLTQLELRKEDRELENRDRMRTAQQRMEDLKLRKEDQSFQREDQGFKREQREQQMKDRQRMAELQQKLNAGELTPGEQIEFHSLGGSPYVVDAATRGGYGGLGMFGMDGDMGPDPDTAILEAGSGAAPPPAPQPAPVAAPMVPPPTPPPAPSAALPAPTPQASSPGAYTPTMGLGQPGALPPFQGLQELRDLLRRQTTPLPSGARRREARGLAQ